MANKKKGFGIFNSDMKVRYGIGIFDSHTINKVRWVTEIQYEPHKEFKFDYGKPAWFTNDREYTEELATLMNINGFPAFVIEVPELNTDYYSNFINEKEPKSFKNLINHFKRNVRR